MQQKNIERTFEVIYTNGSAKAKASTLIKALTKMKLKKNAKIGSLVIVKENGINNYWSGLEFIKQYNRTHEKAFREWVSKK